MQLEPQLQEPEEEQPQSPMMSVVLSKEKGVCCSWLVYLFDGNGSDVKEEKKRSGRQTKCLYNPPLLSHEDPQ